MTAVPRNAAYDKTTVFDAAGTPFEVTRLNALDLTRSGKYFWQKNGAVEAAVFAQAIDEQEAKAAADLAETLATFIDAKQEPEEAPEEVTEQTIYLTDEALLIAGYDSAEAYLETFSKAALKDILEKQYGVTVDGRTGKEKLIDKIIEADAAKE